MCPPRRNCVLTPRALARTRRSPWLRLPSRVEEVTPGFEPCPPQNVAVCPACLDPVLPEGAGPATACRWPVCGHSYHALCLARSRTHVQRMQCALCRQGWRPAFDSDLEALCGQLGIDWHALQLHDPVPVQPAPSAGVASDDADVAMAPAAPELDAFVASAPVAPANLVEPAPPPAVGPDTWTAARPPLAEGQVPPVNSWFFAPLLLAGGCLLLQNAERQWSAHPVLAVGWQAAVSQLVVLRRCLCLGSCLSLRPCRMLLPWMVDVLPRPKPCWCRRSVRRAQPCRPTRLCIFGGCWSDALHRTAMSLPPLRKRCCKFSDLSVLADRLRSGASPPVVSLRPAALTVAPVPASSLCLPVELPGPPSLPSAAPARPPSRSSWTSQRSGGPAGPRPGAGATPAPWHSRPQPESLDFPGPWQATRQTPCLMQTQCLMHTRQLLCVCLECRNLKAHPCEQPLPGLTRLICHVCFSSGACFSKAPRSSSAALSGRPCLLPCGPSTPPGLTTRPSRLERGFFGCYCPVCFSTGAPTLTGLPSPSGVPGFWISKPAGGRHCLSPPLRAFQLQPVPPPRRPGRSSTSCGASCAVSRPGRAFSCEFCIGFWTLGPARLPPWPSYRTPPGGRTSRTTPSMLQFWFSNLSPLSCSQLPQCLAICGGLGKERLPAPPVTQRSSAVWRWMTRRLVPVRAASALAQARVPPRIAAAFGLGRMVALQKPNGRVRGIVVGDFLRRLVARS